MALTYTPQQHALGTKAPDFSLPATDGKTYELAQCRGEKATIIMFICNHCPYVKAILSAIVQDMNDLLRLGVASVAIMPNDTQRYPEDSLENMKALSHRMRFPFPYLIDEKQEVTRRYGAVCTPEFFGYDHALTLRYRGRLSDKTMAHHDSPQKTRKRELVHSMERIIQGETDIPPAHPAMGCSIKFR
ncbi:MAG: thioredoxin family protein [Alphaproteobacteria bacterium GM7ARS4]|nr:thioredoxin family protein [Alphaproteobacteria bacterium GM7ARS4]